MLSALAPLPAEPNLTRTSSMLRKALSVIVLARNAGQQHGQQPKQWQERAQPVGKCDSPSIRHDAEQSCAQSTRAESQAKKDAADHTDPAWDQLLCKQHD